VNVHKKNIPIKICYTSTRTKLSSSIPC